MTNTYPAQFSERVERVKDIPPVGRDEELACEWGDPQKCADDNELRARYAGIALKAYAKRTGGLKSEPVDSVIGDMLNDLRHLCDALGLDFDGLSERTRYHYDAELRGTF